LILLGAMIKTTSMSQWGYFVNINK